MAYLQTTPDALSVYYSRSPIVYRYSGATNNFTYKLDLYISDTTTVGDPYATISMRPDLIGGMTFDVSRFIHSYLKQNMIYSSDNIVYFVSILSVTNSIGDVVQTIQSPVSLATLGYYEDGVVDIPLKSDEVTEAPLLNYLYEVEEYDCNCNLLDTYIAYLEDNVWVDYSYMWSDYNYPYKKFSIIQNITGYTFDKKLTFSTTTDKFDASQSCSALYCFDGRIKPYITYTATNCSSPYNSLSVYSRFSGLTYGKIYGSSNCYSFVQNGLSYVLPTDPVITNYSYTSCNDCLGITTTTTTTPPVTTTTTTAAPIYYYVTSQWSCADCSSASVLNIIIKSLASLTMNNYYKFSNYSNKLRIDSVSNATDYNNTANKLDVTAASYLHNAICLNVNCTGTTTTTTTTAAPTTTTTTTSFTNVDFTISNSGCLVVASNLVGGSGTYQYAGLYTSSSGALNATNWYDYTCCGSISFNPGMNGTYYVAIRDKFNTSNKIAKGQTNAC